MTLARKAALTTIAVMAALGLMTTAAIAADTSSRPQVIGHRGLLQSAPENTLAGFRACLELRVGFEFDVRRTSDGQLVCLHDQTLERTTNGKGLLSGLPWSEVEKLDAGGWFDPAFRGERVPRVDQVFAL